MNDFQVIEQASGEAGALAGSARAFVNLNDALTTAFDGWLGPDAVDAFDASCNTCKHFQRSRMTPEQHRERNIFGMPGHCAKKNIAVTGWQRGQFDAFLNAACYENRRTGKTHAEAIPRAQS